jgi:hypothetical protein
MTNSASAGGAAFDAYADLDLDVTAITAERDRRYRARLADEADAAVVKIEAQIEGLRQSLATRRAEAEEYRTAAAEMGA